MHYIQKTQFCAHCIASKLLPFIADGNKEYQAFLSFIANSKNIISLELLTAERSTLNSHTEVVNLRRYSDATIVQERL